MQAANECPRICGECPNCFNLTRGRIRDVLYAIDEKIAQHSKYLICKLRWGYGCKADINEADYEKLLSYKYSILRFYQSLREGYEPCLCPEEIQSIIEKSLDLVDISCCTSPNRKDILIDKSKFDLWVLENPGCVAYDNWERGLINACPKVGITVKSVKKSCDILSTVKLVDDKCKFLYTVSVYSVADSCIKVKTKVDRKECKLKYDALVKEYNCSLSFSSYLKLIECNMTAEVIGSFLSCGLGVDYNVKNGCPEVKVATQTLSLCDTKVNIFSTSVDDALLKEFSGTDVDPYEVDKLIESYVENCELIKKEINGI